MCNKSEVFLALRRWKGDRYYRPPHFNDESPVEQRNARGIATNLLPRLDWFNTSSANLQDEMIQNNLSIVNIDIRRCVHLKQGIQTKEYTRE